MPPLTTLSRADGSDSSTPAKTAAALAVKAGGETEASKRGDAGSTSALASSSGVGGGDGHSASGDGRRGGLIKATAEGGVSGLGLPLLGMQTVAEEQEADMSLTIAAGGRRALPRASAEVNLAGRRTGSGGGGMENGEAGRVAGVVLDRSSAVAGTAMAAPAVLERTAAAAVVGTVAGAEGSADTAGRGISTTSGGRFSGTVQGMDAADAVGRAATPGRRFSARDSGVDIFSSAPAAASVSAAAAAEGGGEIGHWRGGRRDDNTPPLGSEVTDTSDLASCSSGSSGGHSNGSGGGSHGGSGSHRIDSHRSNGSSSSSRSGRASGGGGGVSRMGGGRGSESGLLGGTISTGSFGSMAKPSKVSR